MPDDESTELQLGDEQRGHSVEQAELIEHAELIEPAELIVRRTPRYFRFMALFAVIAAIVVFVWTYSLPEEPGYPRNEVFGFMLLWGVMIGIGVGAVVALVAERLTRRAARTLPAEHIITTTVEPTDDLRDFRG